MHFLNLGKSSQFLKIDFNFQMRKVFYAPHFPHWSTFRPRAWLMDSIKPSRSYLSSLTEILRYWKTDTEVLFVLFLRYWEWRWCTLKVLILSSTDGLHPIGPSRYRACPGKLQDMCDVCKSNRLALSWINSGWEWLFIQIRLLCVRLLRGFDIIYFVTLNFHIEFCHTETGWIRIIIVNMIKSWSGWWSISLVWQNRLLATRLNQLWLRQRKMGDVTSEGTGRRRNDKKTEEEEEEQQSNGRKTVTRQKQPALSAKWT